MVTSQGFAFLTVPTTWDWLPLAVCQFSRCRAKQCLRIYIVSCAKPAAENPKRQTAIANDCASAVYMGRGEAARAASGNEDVIFIGRRLMSGTDRRTDRPLEEEVTLSCGKYRYMWPVLKDDSVWSVQVMLEGRVIHYHPYGHGYV